MHASDVPAAGAAVNYHQGFETTSNNLRTAHPAALQTSMTASAQAFPCALMDTLYKF